MRRETIGFRRGSNSAQERSPRGRNGFGAAGGRKYPFGKNCGSANPKATLFFLHTIDFSIGANLVHILFTPGLFAPGLRRQIRNRGLTAQEKTGTLFCFCAQKNLDEDDTLAGSIFARKAIF
jgi:hypothetical protein